MATCYTHVQFAFEIPYKKDRGVRVSTQTTSARKVLSIIYRGSHRTESPLDIGCCGHQGPVMTSKDLIQFLSHTQLHAPAREDAFINRGIHEKRVGGLSKDRTPSEHP